MSQLMGLNRLLDAARSALVGTLALLSTGPGSPTGSAGAPPAPSVEACAAPNDLFPYISVAANPSYPDYKAMGGVANNSARTITFSWSAKVHEVYRLKIPLFPPIGVPRVLFRDSGVATVSSGQTVNLPLSIGGAFSAIAPVGGGHGCRAILTVTWTEVGGGSVERTSLPFYLTY